MSFFRIYFLFVILIYYCSNAQCASTNTINNLNPICGDLFIGVQSSGIIKIKLMDLFDTNTTVFSTVGETTGDTFLALYDSGNNLLASNDDDPNCGGCKQSTIRLVGVPYDGVRDIRLSGYYLVLSKPGCATLDFSTDLKYNSRNEYDSDPKITSPIAIVQCIGSTVNFIYSLPSGVVGDNLATPWSSEDTSVATINRSSGEVTFINNGIAKVKLSVKSSCPIINNYIVKGSLTSIINH